MEFDEEFDEELDDAFYDELERAYIAELEHVRAGGVDLTEAILREEVYERLIGELEREDVSSDARDAVASFLQDLRRDGVDWYRVGDGRGYFEADDERRVFPEYAAPCTRATRIPGSVCMKFAHEHGAPWDQWTCAYAADFGNLQSLQYAHEHGCPWDELTCRGAAEKGHLECLKYACAHGFPGSDPYATALDEVCIPDADKRLGVEVALMFHRANGGDISMREFLPVWKEHGELYREAHLRVARELAPTLCAIT